MELLGILIIYIFSPLETFLKIGDAGTISKYLGLIIFGTFLIRTQKKDRIYVPKETYLLLGYIFWGIISIFWASDPNVSIGRSITLVQLFLLYIITSNAMQKNNSKLVKESYNIIIILGMLFSLYVLWQVISLGSVNQWTRVSISNDVDVNHLAAFLITSFLLSLHYTLYKSFKYLIPSVIILLAILVTQSRGAFIAVIISVVYYMLKSQNIKRNKRIKYVLVVIMVLSISFMIVPDEFTYRIKLMFTDIEVLSSGSGRNIIWEWAWQEFINKPLTGIGVGNFTVLYRPPHSSFFQVLSELGIIGIGLIALFLVYLFKDAFRKKSVGIEHIVVISLIIMSLTVDIFYQKYLWIILGICSSKNIQIKKQNT